MIRYKKIIRVFAVLLTSIAITTAVVLGYEMHLDRELLNFDKMCNNEIGKIYSLEERDKGTILLKNAAKRDELLILGSSELDSDVPQNIKNMFPNTELDCNVNIVGRAYTQSLLDAIRVGALSDSLKGKKLVTIVSLQWFLQWLAYLGNEIDINGYNSNFSELQFYDFMNNKNISQEVKTGICKRAFELSKSESSLQRTNTFADLYSKNNFASNAILSTLKPYYALRQRLLEIRDKHWALKKLNEYKDKQQSTTRSINWDEEEKIAEQMGREACTNNNFYVYDEYYRNYIEPRGESLKDSNKSADLMKSKEWKDYELFLKVCKELELKPYFIIVPTNGFYYDYIGISQEKRAEFYDKLESMAKSYGFDYLDMREKEYEPYFFRDIMHLGWKGWLYVSKKITEYYS